MLSYYGASYGMPLGAIYAGLFPATTGRMILDGNLNLVAWSTGNSRVPPFSRLGSAQAAEAVMTVFLDLCGKDSAAMSRDLPGLPEDHRDRWHAHLRGPHRLRP
jgi:hypothetical protein